MASNKTQVKPVNAAKPAAQSAHEDNGNGIASLVLGISSILIPFLGIITGILAIIYSNKQKKIQPNGMATAGMVTGIVGLVFQAMFILTVIVIFMIIGAVASGTMV
ncbi:MAG: hypothetical protein ACP5N3_05495 [Candidatus Nanoarchaeia archaeon]